MGQGMSALEMLARKNNSFHTAEDLEKKDLVFGLDIGTRNVVGIVGYKTEEGFEIVREYSMVHDTRAMLDGQIHDIKRVSETCRKVKEELENELQITLKEVCIAAAGRVLRTVTTKVEYDYPEETVVIGDDLNTLDLMGIDQAEKDIMEDNQRYHFYCVGYSVIRYYLNGEIFSHLEGHKAKNISEELIVTFLPEDVVEGLYAAVKGAGLEVANLTLEPIAAMDVAVPENYRMLNIGLVDVGAGTSDICITKDGAIIAYGMIPHAGDELTEAIVQTFLVDFQTAENVKIASTTGEMVSFKDIMGIEHNIKPEEVWKVTDPIMEKITDEVADKLKELNGGKSVAATFVVGGGGKIHGFCERLSEKLGIIHERVALRGEEVMGNIHFEQRDVKKDPLLVTPIGICLNYYEQKNSFIRVLFNGESLKLYDNGKLKVVDAALAAGLATDDLFPRRGNELHFTVNGEERMVVGKQGESALITLDGQSVGLNTPIHTNSVIIVKPSTVGPDATCSLSDIGEFKSSYLDFYINSQKIQCPKFFEVNGELEGGTYEIKEGDDIETRNYYTIAQLVKFMDVELSEDREILVNNMQATMDTFVYENFKINWTLLEDEVELERQEALEREEKAAEKLNEESSENIENSETEEKEEIDESQNASSDGNLDKIEDYENETSDKDIEKAAKSESEIAEEDIENIEKSEMPSSEVVEEKVDENGKETSDENVLKKDETENISSDGDREREGNFEPEASEDIEKTDVSEISPSEENEEKIDESHEDDSIETEKEKNIDSHENNISYEEKSSTVSSTVSMNFGSVNHLTNKKFVTKKITFTVNGETKTLSDREDYMFTDIFRVYDFDINARAGTTVAIEINGRDCQYTTPLHDGDVVKIYWKD